ncbi:MAG TPA: ROK family protein [Usitatibacter sp.]|nr:ROK family protein [Usitatibacter sp.]
MSKNGRRAFIGIDIGGTKSLFALFDESFEALAQEKFRTHPEKGGAKEFTRRFDSAVKDLLKVAKKRQLRVTVVGAGCAGDVDMKTGTLRTSPNLGFLEGYEFHHRLEKLTGAKVFVGHDVQTGLYGEYRLGVAKKARHVIGVWIGTGVGGALIIDGRLHMGASGAAGDIGNYLLHSAEPSHESPRKEVLDSVASRTAIAGEAAALAAKRRAPELLKRAGTDVTDIKSGDIAEAIRRGDKMIEKLVRSRARVVGAAVSNMVDFLNPDMVVLGGGLVEALPAMLKREVRGAIDAHCAPKTAKAVKVHVARLHGHSGTIGAAKLALDMFSDDPPIDLEAF